MSDLCCLQGLLLWLQIEGMGDLLDAVALACFGITAEPHFNMPVAVSTMGAHRPDDGRRSAHRR